MAKPSLSTRKTSKHSAPRSSKRGVPTNSRRDHDEIDGKRSFPIIPLIIIRTSSSSLLVPSFIISADKAARAYIFVCREWERAAFSKSQCHLPTTHFWMMARRDWFDCKNGFFVRNSVSRRRPILVVLMACPSPRKGNGQCTLSKNTTNHRHGKTKKFSDRIGGIPCDGRLLFHCASVLIFEQSC